MSLTQGKPLPSIKTTKDVTTKGPAWYDQYLQDLSKPGTELMGKTGEQLVAPMTDLQKGALSTAPTALTRYQGTLAQAGQTAEQAAKGITPELIQSYMNPYTSGVVDEMARLQQQNMQRSMLPTLKSAFSGTGGYGSQRMMGALGQMSADAQANLLGAQTGALQRGYDAALRTAGEQAGLYRQAADLQRGLASTDLDAAMKELESMYGLGSKQQQYEQSKILAPISAARSAADIYANLKVPSTVSEESFGPIPGAYSTSPLAQLAGLASLFASGQGGTSAASGFMKFLKDLFPKDAAEEEGGGEEESDEDEEGYEDEDEEGYEDEDEGVYEEEDEGGYEDEGRYET